MHGLAWGWHPDPFGVHEERYVSVDGEATKLVRDGGAESYDPPPPRLRLVPDDARGDAAPAPAQAPRATAPDWYGHLGCHELAEPAGCDHGEETETPGR